MRSTNEIILQARKLGLAIPAFNIPHLPMVEPLVRAVRDSDSFALLEVARLEWTKMSAKGPKEVAEAFKAHEDSKHVRLHLDHIPVVDEDEMLVPYMSIIAECLDLGFQSVMVDGSRLPLESNIEATRKVAEIAHAKGVACEAELGAVLGHEAGPLPPYDELFASGKGFTDVDEAVRFVRESGCDWLSVAAGNIHGAISEAARAAVKPTARLDIGHIQRLSDATGIPLVLHGGSGIANDYYLRAVKAGIAKVNVGTEVRQAYERALAESGDVSMAQDALYAYARKIIKEYYHTDGIANAIKN